MIMTLHDLFQKWHGLKDGAKFIEFGAQIIKNQSEDGAVYLYIDKSSWAFEMYEHDNGDISLLMIYEGEEINEDGELINYGEDVFLKKNKNYDRDKFIKQFNKLLNRKINKVVKMYKPWIQKKVC